MVCVRDRNSSTSVGINIHGTDQLPGVCCPEVNETLVVARDDEGGIVAELRGQNGAITLRISELQQLALRVRVPDPDHAASTGGQEPCAIT